MAWATSGGTMLSHSVLPELILLQHVRGIDAQVSVIRILQLDDAAPRQQVAVQLPQ